VKRLLATRRRHVALACLLALALVSTAAVASESLTTAEARNHIGETATVCGHVASAHYAARSHGQPTFINLDKPYPNAPFTVLIWGSDREKFGAPETAYQDRDICVTGQIKQYRNAPEIAASEPKQIKIQEGQSR
jgi:DNA/RNA endonuclease YhcR with UshA esterase domain